MKAFLVFPCIAAVFLVLPFLVQGRSGSDETGEAASSPADTIPEVETVSAYEE
ncbi:MAG: hypothetical protein AAGJ31_14105 [Verrucomicrobiota bacterium]